MGDQRYVSSTAVSCIRVYSEAGGDSRDDLDQLHLASTMPLPCTFSGQMTSVGEIEKQGKCFQKCPSAFTRIRSSRVIVVRHETRW